MILLTACERGPRGRPVECADQAPIPLYHQDGLSHARIAAALDVPVTTTYDRWPGMRENLFSPNTRVGGHHDTREVYVGFPTWRTIGRQPPGEGLTDRYLAKVGYETRGSCPGTATDGNVTSNEREARAIPLYVRSWVKRTTSSSVVSPSVTRARHSSRRNTVPLRAAASMRRARTVRPADAAAASRDRRMRDAPPHLIDTEIFDLRAGGDLLPGERRRRGKAGRSVTIGNEQSAKWQLMRRAAFLVRSASVYGDPSPAQPDCGGEHRR